MNAMTLSLFGDILDKLNTALLVQDRYKLILTGLKNTLLMAVFATIIGTLIGVIVAVIKYFAQGNKKLAPLGWVCDLYTTCLLYTSNGRGVPVTIDRESIAAAMGEALAPLVLKNATVLNVYTGELLESDVAIRDGIILGVGRYQGEREVDISGRYLVPGFLDAHMHIESSMTTPARLAGEILPWGTTTVIADPHEVANVSGLTRCV